VAYFDHRSRNTLEQHVSNAGKISAGKNALILADKEFEKLGIQLLESREWAILPTVVASLKIFADVVNFCEKEASCISEAIPSAKSIIITLEKTDCKGVVELKETLQQNMNRYFYGGDVRQHFISIEKSELHVIATLLDPRFKKGDFYH